MTTAGRKAEAGRQDGNSLAQRAAKRLYHLVLPMPARLWIRNARFCWKYRKFPEHRCTVRGKELVFSTRTYWAKHFFYPRYSGGGIHEAAVTAAMARPLEDARCFVDVGTHLGWFTCLAGVLKPESEIHGFEMNSESLALAKENVALNGHRNTTFWQGALSDESEGLGFSTFSDGRWTQDWSPRDFPEDIPETRHEVKTISLDDYFESRERLPDIVKIDVDGMEHRVLRGMKEIIKKARPQIFIEVHPTHLVDAGSSAGEVLSFLEERGYSLEVIGEPMVKDAEAEYSLQSIDAKFAMRKVSRVWARPVD